RYEIMPWPDRVFNRPYPKVDASQRKPGEKIETESIPKPYETELQSVITALGDMRQPTTNWEICGTQGVGVLVSDSMMFQRGQPAAADADLGSLFGLA